MILKSEMQILEIPKMKQIISRSIIIISLLLLVNITENISAQDPSPAILTIEDVSIPLGDYLNFINRIDPDRIESEKENSSQFVDYQLKLFEARKRGYDTTGVFLSDIDHYRGLLASGFLDYDRIGEEQVGEYYSRMLREIEISHIQVNIEGDLYKDTLTAYLKIDSIYRLIQAGHDFNTLAIKYSDSGSARDSGYIGYITGMQIRFPLEELSFNTSVGDVSGILRTSNAYHLIKVHDQRDSRGSIMVARIFKKAGANFNEEYNRKVEMLLDSLQKQLMDGEDFNTVSYYNSDFDRTEEFDPVLPVISSGGRMVDFVDAAFSLRYDGEISKVIKTQEGYFLLKRLEYRPVPELNEAREGIIQYYRNNLSRQNYLRDRFLRSVMNSYGFNYYGEAYDRFLRYGRNSFVEGKWIEPSDLEGDRVIFTIGERDIIFKDFSEYLSKQQFAYSFINYPTVMGKHFQDFFLKEITAYEKQHLDSKYPEFRTAMKEFSDALMINTIENEIWNQTSTDSAGIRSYYKKRKGNYHVAGYKGLIIRFRDISARQKLEFEIKNSDLDLYELEGWLKLDYSDLLTTERVLVRKGENNIIDHFIWKQARFENGFSLIFVMGEHASLQAKNFDEAASGVLVDYEKVFEDKWILELRRKYSYKLNKRLIRKISSGR